MARKNTSNDAVTDAPAQKQKKPKKTRWYHQVAQVYKLTVQHDPKARWAIFGVAAGVLALFVLVGLLFNLVWYFAVIGLLFAPLGGMFVLARKAEKVQYSMLEGHEGASRAALGTLRRGWSFPEEPALFDAKSKAVVFRGIGRPGVVLVSEGPARQAEKLVEKEEKRLSRVLPGVPIHVIACGNDEGQVPLPKLTRAVQKLKPKLTRAEVSEVHKRLTALGQVKLPIPKGIDPMRARPDRKGMR
ncbi:DUF4191 domain-containing protein [Timonella sp. A28]|uniref:DUF4191 domain-containing protein n=1 Tax=Timonella sp. A28 TaxID=3442640 RepID=UPI003EBF628E